MKDGRIALVVLIGVAAWLWSRQRGEAAAVVAPLAAPAAPGIADAIAKLKAEGAPASQRLAVAKESVVAQAPEQITAEYLGYASLAEVAAAHPGTPMGVLAEAVINFYESQQAGYADPAMVGEALYGTATGGVSIVSPGIADNLIEAGVEVRVFEAAGGDYANFYYQGEMIAKANYAPYVEKLKATTVTPTAEVKTEVEVTPVEVPASVTEVVTEPFTATWEQLAAIEPVVSEAEYSAAIDAAYEAAAAAAGPGGGVSYSSDGGYSSVSAADVSSGNYGCSA